MRPVAVCVLALLIGLPPWTVSAQTEQAGAQTQPGQAARPAVSAEQARASAAAVVSAVSLDRIKRGLRQAAAAKSAAPMKLEYYVEVLGVAPPFTLFGADEDLGTGRLPYNAPGYSDMRAIMTPVEYRAPVVSFSRLAKGGARSILDRSAARARARRVEEARRKALQAEHERQELLKQTVVAAPPK